MDEALDLIDKGKMSVRGVARRFGIPRASIQDRLYHRVKNGCKEWRRPTLEPEDEEKLIDYASNRAKMGVGFSKSSFIR